MKCFVSLTELSKERKNKNKLQGEVQCLRLYMFFLCTAMRPTISLQTLWFSVLRSPNDEHSFYFNRSTVTVVYDYKSILGAASKSLLVILCCKNRSSECKNSVEMLSLVIRSLIIKLNLVSDACWNLFFFSISTVIVASL